MLGKRKAAAARRVSPPGAQAVRPASLSADRRRSGGQQHATSIDNSRASGADDVPARAAYLPLNVCSRRLRLQATGSETSPSGNECLGEEGS